MIAMIVCHDLGEITLLILTMDDEGQTVYRPL